MRYFISALAILLFFSACKDNSKNELRILAIINDGLNQSSTTILESNNTIYKALDSRLQDPDYSHAEIWQPKALRVKVITANVIKYLDDLKAILKNDAGIKNNDDNKLSSEVNAGSVNKVFDLKGKELYDSLLSYRKTILSVDSLLKNEFEHTFKLFSKNFDYNKSDFKEFKNAYFNNISAIAAISVLNKFENDILINENSVILFCLSKIYNHFCGYYTNYRSIIGQSVNYVKGGDYIEITSGIGYFSTTAKPTMKINGILIEPDADGVMIYKLRVSTKIGKHITPVLIKYTASDGTIQSKTYGIEYTVINPKQLQ